ncbi:helix-turn-helix transcriptional regulator [Salinicoccus roseus]|uniref:helix-turn-helix transcriptional regulator n=1 Tax=Salinicoccus roseus TaxID=45670 RepID=UPI0023008AB2|nr:helix-turn-helix transcriptional regulator [Salinicoccus roseus]
MARTLKEWRVHKGLTQEQFAKELGISPSTYNIWEKKPDVIKIRNVVLLSKTLGVSPQDIIFFDDESYLNFDKEVAR